MRLFDRLLVDRLLDRHDLSIIEEPNYVDARILTANGHRYIRVTDMADLLRGFANALEPAGLVDAQKVAGELRAIARKLEQP